MRGRRRSSCAGAGASIWATSSAWSSRAGRPSPPPPRRRFGRRRIEDRGGGPRRGREVRAAAASRGRARRQPLRGGRRRGRDGLRALATWTASPAASIWRSTAAAARRRPSRPGRSPEGAAPVAYLRFELTAEPARGLDRGGTGPPPRRPPALLGRHRAERRAAGRHRRRPRARVARTASVRCGRRRSPPSPRSRRGSPPAFGLLLAAVISVAVLSGCGTGGPPPPWRSGHPDPASLSLLDSGAGGELRGGGALPGARPRRRSASRARSTCSRAGSPIRRRPPAPSRSTTAATGASSS